MELKEIKIERDGGGRKSTTTVTAGGRSFLVERSKAQCRYTTRCWRRANYGKHYDFPKKAYLFSGYFDWIKHGDYLKYCPRHKNCNFYTVWKVPGIRALMTDRESDYRLVKLKYHKLFTKSETKLAAELWLCNSFPLSLQTMLPLLDVLAKANPLLSKFGEFLKNSSLTGTQMFPMRTVFPVAFSVRAQIQFLNINLA